MSEDFGGPLGEVWIAPREYELGAERWQSAAIEQLARAIDPLLGQVGRETLHDLPEPEDEQASTPSSETPLFRSVRIEHQWTWSAEDVLKFDVDSYLCQLYETAESVGGQMVSAMLHHISAIADEYGQTLSAEGRNFYDLLIEVAEKMDIDFDDDGKPTTMIVVNPETYKKLQADGPTPEQEAKLQTVFDLKRKEWSASRSRRDLP
ncbi:hypothetical protein HGA11_05300 [Mycolicibacterium septicum DSM 44393]|uniref:Uncharacterized protein n=1 Tax=Mycolicibacterium septicum DSM 44393 TaxID=1341646 RepID=A0A7X6RUX9_9MYCO|nr:hypothetical protein [Mycolicibacterium septicum]NKZ10387.1 hypothetical protein [Mycolicibacterium septicum DSM 44393]